MLQRYFGLFCCTKQAKPSRRARKMTSCQLLQVLNLLARIWKQLKKRVREKKKGRKTEEKCMR